MNKEELKALGLTDEQADKVIKGYEGYVPKARFDEVNTAKKKAEDDVKKRDEQIAELKKSTGDSEELKKKIKELEDKNKADKDAYDKELKKTKLDAAIKAAIQNAQDVDIVAGLIDREKLILGDDGKVTGLTEQVAALQKDKAFLFKSGQQQYDPHGSNGSQGNTNPFAKESWNLTKQGELLKKDPAQARALAQAAGVTI